MEKRIEKRKHFIFCNIAGFMYWDGCIVFNKFKIGTKLNLKREQNNKYDSDAVAIYWCDSKLGYIPRSQNGTISQFLDMGYDDMFDVRISRICQDAHPESQVYINIYIKKNNNYDCRN